MRCFVCGGDMVPHCKKRMDFCGFQGHEYIKCESCGLVISKTFYEMPKEQWNLLNFESHKGYQGSDENKDDPRWMERQENQKKVLLSLFDNRLLPENSKCVDYGCGDGKFADRFNAVCNRKTRIEKFDKYMDGLFAETSTVPFLSEEKVLQHTWDVVINCSVLEHILGRTDLDEIMGLVEPNHGILCLHTLICEEIPKDPDWFYYLLTHCTFWTNKAMSLVFEQYAFCACAYHLESRFWFFFKEADMMKKIEENRSRLDGTWVFDSHFVDYWKQKPYRNEG